MKRLAALLAAASCLALIDAQGAEATTALPQARASWASAENDLGETDPNLRLTNLVIVLNRPADRQKAFETLLAEQQDPQSPNFHRWLTPSEIGERFGPSDEDILAVRSWLESHGLRVDSVAASRVRIEFSGRATDVGAAFGASLHAYLVEGETLISPASTA
ncbi:MAG: protease pro-enzyme activation domain-containing protein, partial [Bacillota bacterium]